MLRHTRQLWPAPNRKPGCGCPPPPPWRFFLRASCCVRLGSSRHLVATPARLGGKGGGGRGGRTDGRVLCSVESSLGGPHLGRRAEYGTIQLHPRAFKKGKNKWCSRLVLTCQFHSAFHNQRQEEPARMPSKSNMVLNAQEAGQKTCALSAGQRTSQSDSQAKPQKPPQKKERRKENERTLYPRPRNDCHACEPPKARQAGSGCGE